jgi:hypothetical protein
MKNWPTAFSTFVSFDLNSALYIAEQTQEWFAIEKRGKRATQGA